MNDTFLLNEAKKNLAQEQEFQSRMEVMRGSLAAQLSNGMGEEIKNDIIRETKPTKWKKIKLFFAKIFNTL